jgi:hypothetical protein
MADFAYWIQAIEPGLPWESGGFLQVYRENRQQIIEQVVESDAVASAIRRFIESINNRTWEGSPNDLLIRLDEREAESVKKEKYWPKTASTLSRRLKRSSSFLRKIGIDVITGRNFDGRFIVINHVGIMSAPCRQVTAKKASNDDIMTAHVGNDGTFPLMKCTTQGTEGGKKEKKGGNRKGREKTDISDMPTCGDKNSEYIGWEEGKI